MQSVANDNLFEIVEKAQNNGNLHTRNQQWYKIIETIHLFEMYLKNYYTTEVIISNYGRLNRK